MRIGLFTDTYPPYINGVSTSVDMLKKALEKKGHKVFVLTVNPENMKYNIDDDETVVRIPGLPIGIYDYRLTGIYPLKALGIIKKWNLDIIHSHTEFGIGTFARIVAKQLNIPLVHTYHTMYEDYIHYITKGFFDKSSKKIVEYLTLFYCDKTATELIVPTKKTYDLFKNKYKLNKNIHIVPTGIDIERFYEENIDEEIKNKIKKDLKIKSKDFVYLFVGRLAQEKNIELLLQAHLKLSKRHKHFKFIIAGDGPDYKKYESFINKNNLKDSVIMTGKVSWEDIKYYYNIADIFLTASKTETQGLTVIEAMASSTPPICINDESFNLVIVDKLNGRIFYDEEELISIIENLSTDKKTMKKLKNQARIASNSYSSEFYASSILNVYQYAIDSKKKKKGIIHKLSSSIKKITNSEDDK